MMDLRFYRRTAVALGVACATLVSATRAQELIEQPKVEFLAVDLHSSRDDIKLYPGTLDDPPYVYRGWTRAQRPQLIEHGGLGLLRIWDRALSGNTRVEASDWEIELMPACPTGFSIRTRAGRGEFDLTGMPVQSVDVVSQQTNFELRFDAPNPVRLRSVVFAVHDGSLNWSGVLNANPLQAVLRVHRSKAKLALTGAPVRTTMDFIVYGSEGTLELEAPQGIGLRFSGDAPSLAPLRRAGRLVSAANGLKTPDYDTSGCQIRMHFAEPVKNFKLRWEGAVTWPEAVAQPKPTPTLDATVDPETEEEFSNRLLVFLARLERGELEAAAKQLEDLRSLRPDDGRILFLETWLAENPQLSMTVVPAQSQAERRVQFGIDAYLAGRYEIALREFRAAAQLDPNLDYAQAWIRRTQMEIDRAPRDTTRDSTTSTAPPDR